MKNIYFDLIIVAALAFVAAMPPHNMYLDIFSGAVLVGNIVLIGSRYE